ncbi:hypothetical protein B6S59_03525 [Pseudomonas sp. A46]|nr:hypothetical protein B6S59_03525 [Pseudomonas sp. A46]
MSQWSQRCRQRHQAAASGDSPARVGVPATAILEACGREHETATSRPCGRLHFCQVGLSCG